MANASLIGRLSQAVDQIEKRLKKNRPLKIVKVRCGITRTGTRRKTATSRPIPRTETRIS